MCQLEVKMIYVLAGGGDDLHASVIGACTPGRRRSRNFDRNDVIYNIHQND